MSFSNCQRLYFHAIFAQRHKGKIELRWRGSPPAIRAEVTSVPFYKLCESTTLHWRGSYFRAIADLNIG